MKQWNRKKVMIAVFVAGLIAGTLLVNLLFASKADTAALWQVDGVSSQELSLMGTHEYFVFVLLKRMKQFLLFLVLLLLTNPELAVGAVVLLFSFAVGAVFSLEAMRMGFSGILYALMCFFPHYLCYIGVILAFAFRRRKTEERMRRSGVGKMLILLALVILGCFFEAYGNPVILKLLIS